MLKTLLIDNEKHCLERLHTLLARYCADTVQVIGQYQTVNDALTAIETLKPDLLFLDVRLDNDITCFSLLGGVSSINFDVIFVTAFDEYALRAFQVDAVDYLLKPIDSDKLVKAVGKVLGRSPKDRIDYQHRLSKTADNPTGKVGRISIPTKEGRTYVDVNDIVFCESDGGYTKFWGLKKKYLGMISHPLSDFEESLNDANFCRIHDSYLINLAHLKLYVNGRGGHVEMTDGTHLNVSDQRKADFKRRTQSGVF